MAEEIDAGGGGVSGCVGEAQQSVAPPTTRNDADCRKERRKVTKKEKRKQKRKDLAAKEREEEEARLNDPEEQRRMQLEEERENERLERERKEFEEHERSFLEALAAKMKAEEEEEERRKALEEESKQNQTGHEDESDSDDWEYVEDGPLEIIWQGNEIIVKKKKVRVKRNDADQQTKDEDPNRPTSNPHPPQSEAFSDYKNGSVLSAQQLLENAAQQIPNFGTEQDKAHCPFHLKTGACRFGPRCSRLHFYPDKSCTLLIKNMYNGPGLSWEQDEGLELVKQYVSRGILGFAGDNYVSPQDEEIERCYEEFYEDVHTEFLKFGEIVNFKVCKNGSSQLRGNVYVHYKSLDSAVIAYQTFNGRYFAGKQVTCEFVGVTKWKVAICGEYMKSRLKTCSRGTACNFIHCFRNPGGDYEWADWDKSPPRYWAKKMAALFGHSVESGYDNQAEKQKGKNSSKISAADPDRHYSRRSRSRERDSSRGCYEEYSARRSRDGERYTSGSRKATEVLEERIHREQLNSERYCNSKNRTSDSDYNGDWLNNDRGGDRRQSERRKNYKNQIEVFDTEDCREDDIHGSNSDGHQVDRDKDRASHHVSTRDRDCSSHLKKVSGLPDDCDGSNRPRCTDSSAHSPDEDGDRDIYENQRRKSSRHQNGVPASPDNRRHKRERTYDIDSGDEDRHVHSRQSHLRHSNEGLGLIDSHGNTLKNLKEKYHHRESDSQKLEAKRVKKLHHSSRRDHSSIEPSEATFSAEVLKSDRCHETSSSRLHGERVKSRDIDSRYNSDENIDKAGHPKSRDKFKHLKSSRDSSIDERYESHGASQYGRRSKSRDSDKGDEKQGLWESDDIGARKHLSSTRKFWSGDLDQYGRDPDYDNRSSDECYSESKSRGSEESSRRKSSDGLLELDAAVECRESKEKPKRQRSKHRAHGHKRHHKKDSPYS